VFVCAVALCTKQNELLVISIFSSQVKLLLINHAFCIVQRATAQSKTGNFRDYFAAEPPPGLQAGWSDCMYFFLSLFVHLFARLEFPFKFL
jgi:hypothetical protein